MEVLARLAPERALCVARELTKQFEEFRRGNAGELLAHYRQHPPKGEITFLVAGHDGRAPRPPEGGGMSATQAEPPQA